MLLGGVGVLARLAVLGAQKVGTLLQMGIARSQSGLQAEKPARRDSPTHLKTRVVREAVFLKMLLWNVVFGREGSFMRLRLTPSMGPRHCVPRTLRGGTLS